MTIITNIILSCLTTITFGNRAMTTMTNENNLNIIEDKVTYAIDKPFNKTINTMEAWIKLPNDLKSNQKGGIILGNYLNSSFGYNGACDFLIDYNGNFRIFYNRISGNTAQVDHIFTNYDFRTGNFEHIALTRDPSTNTFTLFANGNKVDEFTAHSTEAICTMRYQIGCDWRNWTNSIDGNHNRLPFQGEIRSIALYDIPLSNSQIKEDMQKEIIENNDHLLVSYNMHTWGDEEIFDYSSYHNNAKLYNYEKYFDMKEEEEFDYSILCIPDMQITTRYSPTKLDAEFDWILANKDSKNIQYISFVGDLTDTCDLINGIRTPNLPQWNTVVRNFNKLNQANISYGFVPGNHDYDDGVGRSRSASFMNTYLPYKKYSNHPDFGGAYLEGDILNYYNKKKINGIDYLFLNLEFGPRDSVLLWANRVIEQNPTSRVIISTHSYIEPDGRITNASDQYAASKYGIGGGNSSNDGIDMWNKLVKKHSNIFIVFSGHNSSDDIIYRKDIGEHGNTIHSFLIDAQGSFDSQSCDVLSIFKINEEQKKAYVYWYSPNEGKYLNKQNQFVIDFQDNMNKTIGLPISKSKLYVSKDYITLHFLILIPFSISIIKYTNKKGEAYEK